MMAAAVSAQITWNAKAGIGISTLDGLSTDYSKKTHLVGKIGAGIEYPLGSNWSLMPSLEIAWKGMKIESDNSYRTMTSTVDLLYAQIPVVAAYRINLSQSWNLTLKAGPYFAYAFYDHLNNDYTSKTGNNIHYNSGNEDLDAKKFDVGIDIGIDFEYHRFVFGVEGELGFLEMAKDTDARNLAGYATVGWKF